MLEATTTAARTTWLLAALTTLAAVTGPADAQDLDLLAELRSGDGTRCMEAGNASSDYREQAAALAGPLFDLIEEGTGCVDSAVSTLTNLGEGIRQGVAAARAVPILVGLIEQGIEPEYGPLVSRASSAVLVLGSFGEDAAPALPVLERWIRERSEGHEKRYALMTIGDLGAAGAAAAPLLVELLSADPGDDSYERGELRVEAARTLESLPAASALAADALVAALSAEDWTLRSLAADALSAAGSGVLPAVLRELESDDQERREQAIRILTNLGEDARSAGPVVAGLLVDENWTVQYQAAELLEAWGPDEAVIARLAAMMHESKNEDAVARAAEILGSYGPAAASAVPALRHAITRKSWSVTQAAEDAIRKIEGGGG
jgi:HEAT repeat protein